jgi:hypothetical protein
LKFNKYIHSTLPISGVPAPFATFGATKVVQKRLFTPCFKKREAYFQPISGTYSVKLNPSIICKSAGFFVPIQVKSPVSTFFSIVILCFVTLTFTKSPCSKPYFFKYSPLMFMAFVYLFPCADLQTVSNLSIFLIINSGCNGLLILPSVQNFAVSGLGCPFCQVCIILSRCCKYPTN